MSSDNDEFRRRLEAELAQRLRLDAATVFCTDCQEEREAPRGAGV